MMKRVIVIGCSGAGKSTFSRKLAEKTGLPLYYLDMIWHKPDKTVISREAFDHQLSDLLDKEEWIIDGNYRRTLPMRLEKCDTVFLFDLPLKDCIEGVKSRIGTKRVDLPWVEEDFDPEFRQWIENFRRNVLPGINDLLAASGKTVIRFTSRSEADEFIRTM